jgi:hypothetical protein
MIETSVLAETSETPTDPVADARQGWQVYADDTYGFQFSYPPDWTVQELVVDGPGMPDDWPVVRTVQAYPTAWADEISRSGPPDPTRPPVVAPLNIEVCVGPLEQYQRAYPAPDQSEIVTINGVEVQVERDVSSEKITQIWYAFQSPTDGELRIVVSDMLTGFASRVARNEDVAEVIPLLVATLEFVE